MQTTICPECHKKGKRVVMEEKRLPQPDLTPKGDRFPGQIVTIPAVYYCHTNWKCGECGHSHSE